MCRLARDSARSRKLVVIALSWDNSSSRWSPTMDLRRASILMTSNASWRWQIYSDKSRPLNYSFNTLNKGSPIIETLTKSQWSITILPEFLLTSSITPIPFCGSNTFCPTFKSDIVRVFGLGFLITVEFSLSSNLFANISLIPLLNLTVYDRCCNYSVHHRGLSLSKTGNNISIPALQIHWENSYLCTGK